MKFPPLSGGLTVAERVLGRPILTEPPTLHDWIKRFGSYANITPEAWAEYNAAKRKWEEERIAGTERSRVPADGSHEK